MANQLSSTGKDVLLLLQVPRTNAKKELAAEQMFASLQGLLTIPTRGILNPPKRERLSFEIAVLKKHIGFYVWVPDYLRSYVEEQIYAQYPSVQISQVNDYTQNSDKVFSTVLGTEIKLTAHNSLPIKTFQSFEVDPLAAITASLAKFGEDEEAWIQLIIRPATKEWHRRSERYIANLTNKSSPNLLTALINAPPSGSARIKTTDSQQIRASAAEVKSKKVAFEASLRIIYRGNLFKESARLRVQSIVSTFKQFNTTYLNSFEAKRITDDPHLVLLYQARAHSKRIFICNIEEIATLYHLPHTSVETPYILWATSQTAEPPANLPIVDTNYDSTISPIAVTNFRGHNTMFGLPRSDRSRHLYILGQTGVGKSGLLELLTISDISSPHGFAVIDPHGDYATDILRRITPERIKDVIYFNPADVDYPISFNPMEVYDEKLKNHTCSELIGVLKRMFDSWGPRLEYILRYAILALLDYPGTTMLDITRLLTDEGFRDQVIDHLKDPVVRNFWTVEFGGWSRRYANEAVAPVLNKIGAFTANPMIRNIIGQPTSSFNIRKVMDEHKILIVNLSRGLVGEDNAALLGALLVTKIQLAAMSRADMPIADRSPFYLYVDEFQNFATDSFKAILSEARKYGLNLTVANQYTAQMIPGVRDAIFGNVGSIISFRSSADDGRIMQHYFEPEFSEHSLVQMHNRYFVISMTINGEKAQPFSAITLNLPPRDQDYSPIIIQNSRSLYASSKEKIQYQIKQKYFANPDTSDEAQNTIVAKAELGSIKPGYSKAVQVENIKSPKKDETGNSITSRTIFSVSEIMELEDDIAVKLH